MANLISLPSSADSTVQIKSHNHHIMKKSLLTAARANSAKEITQGCNIRLFNSFITFTTQKKNGLLNLKNVKLF